MAAAQMDRQEVPRRVAFSERPFLDVWKRRLPLEFLSRRSRFRSLRSDDDAIPKNAIFFIIDTKELFKKKNEN